MRKLFVPVCGASVLFVIALVVALAPSSRPGGAATSSGSANEGLSLVDPQLLAGFDQLPLEDSEPLCPLAGIAGSKRSEGWVSGSDAVALSAHDGVDAVAVVDSVSSSSSRCALFTQGQRRWVMTDLERQDLSVPAVAFKLVSDDGWTALVAVAAAAPDRAVVVSVLGFAPDGPFAGRLLLDAISRAG